jgi:hypothetical protein
VKRFIYILLLFSVACSYFKNPSAPQSPLWSPVFDAAALDDADLIAARATGEFYKRNSYHFVWLDSGGVRQAADSMITMIRSAGSYGLIPEDYHAEQIGKLLAMPHDAQHATALELYLTDSFLAMCYHLKYGRVERKDLSGMCSLIILMRQILLPFTACLPGAHSAKFCAAMSRSIRHTIR